MTERTAALRSLRSKRTDGLPPPPPLVSAPRPSIDAGAHMGGGSGPPHQASVELPVVDAQSNAGAERHRAESLEALVTDPVKACREMGNLRENMPARPLNVDLTPGVAAAFDQECRALRVKKKDVVELLLRGWLQHQGRDLA